MCHISVCTFQLIHYGWLSFSLKRQIYSFNLKECIHCKEQTCSSLGETGGYPQNPFSFRYLQVTVQGTPLKMPCQLFPYQNCLNLECYVAQLLMSYAYIVDTNGCLSLSSFTQYHYFHTSLAEYCSTVFGVCV